MTKRYIPFRISGVSCQYRVFSLKQKGMVLEIVLVVLVALMLASISLFRSVDTSSSVATNIAFKSDAGNRAQLAFDQIFSWLNDRAAYRSYVINGMDCPTCNFSSQMLQTNAKGIPNIIAGNVSAFDAIYTNAPPATALMNNDGMRVRYLIERMCTRAGRLEENYCTMASVGKDLSGDAISKDPDVLGKPVLRVTVRVDGPRNTLSFVQANVSP